MQAILCGICKGKEGPLYQGQEFNSLIICRPCVMKLKYGILKLMGPEFIRSLYMTPRGFFHIFAEADGGVPSWPTDSFTFTSTWSIEGHQEYMESKGKTDGHHTEHCMPPA